MKLWTTAELTAIAEVGEVHVSSRRPDGSLSRGQTIWAVVVDGSVFIRSTDGPDKPWFRAAKNRGVGCFQAGDLILDVTFDDVSDLDQGPIEAEYRRKYHRSPAYNVNRAAGSSATLRLLPQRN
jgi:hypothetical protein